MTISNKRLPAEWELQSAVLLTWPHKNTDWKNQLSAVEAIYYTLAKTILTEQKLIISCEDSKQLDLVTHALRSASPSHKARLSSFLVPANDTWARDHGPIGIIENNTTTLLDFDFNAWGGKYEANKDNDITQNLFKLGAFPNAKYQKIDFVLEGGSIESDGKGTILTTERCLLNATRNKHFSKQEIEEQLKKTLGAQRILWLKHGYLAGDDTDAHIDTLARFCSPNTICYVSCDEPNDEHYTELKAMEHELKALSSNEGEPYKLIALPMPTAIYDTSENSKKRLPATYANFLITNQSILLPIYQTPEDEQAIKQIQSCFSDKTIVPIDCNPLIKEHGSLHCITMQLTQGSV
ncbi:MAG: agmatine/peptidylarginine deiminase [Oleiphilaceae bacterium]|jgi:agmatine deiminase